MKHILQKPPTILLMKSQSVSSVLLGLFSWKGMFTSNSYKIWRIIPPPPHFNTSPQKMGNTSLVEWCICYLKKILLYSKQSFFMYQMHLLRSRSNNPQHMKVSTMKPLLNYNKCKRCEWYFSVTDRINDHFTEGFFKSGLIDDPKFFTDKSDKVVLS